MFEELTQATTSGNHCSGLATGECSVALHVVVTGVFQKNNVALLRKTSEEDGVRSKTQEPKVVAETAEQCCGSESGIMRKSLERMIMKEKPRLKKIN